MKYKMLSILVAVFSSSIFAAPYSGTGSISKLVSIPADENRDYILVSDFDAAGSCPNAKGLVVAKFQTTESGSRAYSLALAAKMAGKNVKLVVEDTSKNQEGFCYVYAIEITE